MSNFFEKLKTYFEETPHDKVLDDWNKTEVLNDGGPTVEEFIANSHLCYSYFCESEDHQFTSFNKNNLNPNFSSGFFLLINKINHGKCFF